MTGIGVALLAVTLIVFNVLMWIILFIKFDRKFSTERIVETAKKQINDIIADMNRQTDRNITLLQNAKSELKAVIAEADRHVTVAKNEVEKLNQVRTQLFAQRIQQSAPPESAPHRPSARKSAAQEYQRYAAEAQQPLPFSVTDEGKKQVVHQGDLFDERENPPEPNVFTVSHDGAAYTSVPVIGPEVVFADEPIVPKKDFPTQVREHYDRGESVDQIAVALGRSTTEVQFALDMGA